MSSNEQAVSEPVYSATYFDAALSLSRVGGSREFLRELVGVFLNEYPGLLNSIDESIHKRDSPTLKRSAHTLKGAMNNFGAAAACAIARQLEERGRDSQLADASAIAAELRPAVEKLANELERFAG